MTNPAAKPSPAKRGRGRPKHLPDTANITIAIDREHVHTAEGLVSAFDKASALGMRHTRIDVLRAAIAKGLEVLRTQSDSLT